MQIWRNSLPIIERLLESKGSPNIRDAESGWCVHSEGLGTKVRHPLTCTFDSFRLRLNIPCMQFPCLALFAYLCNSFSILDTLLHKLTAGPRSTEHSIGDICLLLLCSWKLVHKCTSMTSRYVGLKACNNLLSCHNFTLGNQELYQQIPRLVRYRAGSHAIGPLVIITEGLSPQWDCQRGVQLGQWRKLSAGHGCRGAAAHAQPLGQPAWDPHHSPCCSKIPQHSHCRGWHPLHLGFRKRWSLG